MPSTNVPLLQELCLRRIADNIHKFTTLQGLSEDLVCELFALVLKGGRLSPDVLQLFTNTEHELLLAMIKGLNLRAVPPRLPVTRNLWLGDNPTWR